MSPFTLGVRDRNAWGLQWVNQPKIIFKQTNHLKQISL